jgi:hypothetical protein
VKPKKKRGRRAGGARTGAPSVRLPLPKKGESRHGDRTKYDRAREKARLARERRDTGGSG